MSFWDDFKTSLGFGGVQNATALPALGSPQIGPIWASMFGNPEAGGLPLPSEASVMTLSAAEACVGVVSGAVASLPMHIYKRGPEGQREQLYNDPLWWILNEEFSPRWSAAAGWEYLCRSRMYHGDGFAIIRRQGARIVGLEPVHPNRVTVFLSEDKRLIYAVESEPNAVSKREVFDQDDMLHIVGDGFNGFRTPSPLRNQLRLAAASALAMQEYNARFFANSARPDYVLEQKTGTTALTQEQVEALRRQIEENNGGLSNSRKPMVLTGLEFKSVTMPLEDVELLALRQFAVEEIARIYRVPPFMIGHNEKTTSWGSGVEAMGVGFVRYTLRQHLNHFTNEINRKLFRTAAKFAEFDTTELERADTKSLFESYALALGGQGRPGFMSQNEIRRRQNMPPITGGDTINDGSMTASATTTQGQPA